MDIQAYVTTRITKDMFRNILFYLKLAPSNVNVLDMIDSVIAQYVSSIDSENLSYRTHTELGIICTNMVHGIEYYLSAPYNLNIDDAYDKAFEDPATRDMYTSLTFTMATFVAKRLSILKNEVAFLTDKLTESVTNRVVRETNERETPVFDVLDWDDYFDEATKMQFIVTAKQLTNTFRSSRLSLSDASSIIDKMQYVLNIIPIKDITEIQIDAPIPMFLFDQAGYKHIVEMFVRDLTDISHLSAGVVSALRHADAFMAESNAVLDDLNKVVTATADVTRLITNIAAVRQLCDLARAAAYIYKSYHLNKSFILTENTVSKDHLTAFTEAGGDNTSIAAIVEFYKKHSINAGLPNYGVTIDTAIANKDKYTKIVLADLPTEDEKIAEYNIHLEMAIKTVLNQYFDTYYPEPTQNERDRHETSLARIGLMIPKYKSNVSDVILDYLVSTYSTDLYSLYKYIKSIISKPNEDGTTTASEDDVKLSYGSAVLQYLMYTVLDKYTAKP